MAHEELKPGIDRESDPAKTGKRAKNLNRLHDRVGMDWAKPNLYSVFSGAEEGAVAQDAWRSIHSLEEALTDERGKTTRLARTRQKMARACVRKMVADAAQSAKPSESFRLLVAGDFNDLHFESDILRHLEDFDETTKAAAHRRFYALKN